MTDLKRADTPVVRCPKRWRCRTTFLFLCIGFVSGCSWTDNAGKHQLIVGVGFGIITTTNRSGVEVRDARVLGAEFGPDGAGVGWMQHHRVVIDPVLASNVVVSIKANPLSLTVKNFNPYSANTNIEPRDVSK